MSHMMRSDEPRGSNFARQVLPHYVQPLTLDLSANSIGTDGAASLTELVRSLPCAYLTATRICLIETGTV